MMVARVVAHTGFDHTLVNRTPSAAMASSVGVEAGLALWFGELASISAPTSSAMISRMLGCAGAAPAKPAERIDTTNTTSAKSFGPIACLRLSACDRAGSPRTQASQPLAP